MGLLTRPELDPRTLCMGGVGYGAPARAIPREAIKFVDSPIVHANRSGTNIQSEYYGADGRRLTPDEVIDSVLDADGTLHLTGKISYLVRDGAVAGFAISRQRLDHFAFLRTYEEFRALFGAADRVEVTEDGYDFGDPLAYWHRYYASPKCVCWDNWDHRVSLINLGDYPGNRPGDRA